jgi:predicted dehydrogenase
VTRIVRLAQVGLANHYNAYGFAEELAAGVDGVQLVGVTDPDEKQAEEFADRYCPGGWSSDLQDLITRPDVDAVIVSSPTAQHADHVDLAARHGKPVLLEKPIATCLTDARRIESAARESVVMMAYTMPHLPAARDAVEAVRRGDIGRPLTAFYTVRVPVDAVTEAPGAGVMGWYGERPQSGGGGFLDHGVIFADFLCRLFASEPVSVQATITTFNPTLSVEDYGIATYTLRSGAVVTIESTWHAPVGIGEAFEHEHCRITGTEGELTLRPSAHPQLEVHSLGQGNPRRTGYDYLGADRYDISLRRTLEDFAAVVRGDQELRSTAALGRRALQMMLAAYEASESGRVISLA